MKQQSRRLDFAVPVMVSKMGEDKWTCHIVELNASGLLIESNRSFTDGENITLHLLRDNLNFTVLHCKIGLRVEKYLCQLNKENKDMNLDTYFSSFSKFAV